MGRRFDLLFRTPSVAMETLRPNENIAWGHVGITAPIFACLHSDTVKKTGDLRPEVEFRHCFFLLLFFCVTLL